MSNILFIRPHSQYNAIGNYVDELEKAFCRMEHHIYDFDPQGEDSITKLLQIATVGKIDVLFSFNATHAETPKINQLFREARFVTYLCDHPLFHKNRMELLDEDCIVFTCDKRHEQYIRHYYPNIQDVFFVPLSGSVSDWKIPYRERENEVIFTGSYQKPEIVMNRLKSKFHGTLYQFAMDMKQSILLNPTQDLEQCLNGSLLRFGIKISDAEFAELAFEYRDIDQYARVYYRDQMIRILVRSGVRIHVYGNGWDEFEGEGKENLLVEKGDAKVALKAVANAKISLNIMPWFKAGFQERIATAMLSGAVAVTDSSSYIEQHFTDGRELVLYDLQNIKALPDKINWLLTNEDVASKIAETGQKSAQTKLTWQHRAEEIMRDIQLSDS